MYNVCINGFHGNERIENNKISLLVVELSTKCRFAWQRAGKNVCLFRCKSYRFILAIIKKFIGWKFSHEFDLRGK